MKALPGGGTRMPPMEITPLSQTFLERVWILLVQKVSIFTYLSTIAQQPYGKPPTHITSNFYLTLLTGCIKMAIAISKYHSG